MCWFMQLLPNEGLQKLVMRIVRLGAARLIETGLTSHVTQVTNIMQPATSSITSSRGQDTALKENFSNISLNVDIDELYGLALPKIITHRTSSQLAISAKNTIVTNTEYAGMVLSVLCGVYITC